MRRHLDIPPRRHVREIRPDVRARRRAPDLMAVRAALAEEELKPGAARRRCLRALGREPLLEARAGLGDHDQFHVRVLHAAELRALAEICPRPVGVEQDAIRAAGGIPFTDYQVPQAVIKLKQGFGRLIRTRRDTGLVVILDPRVRLFSGLVAVLSGILSASPQRITQVALICRAHSKKPDAVPPRPARVCGRDLSSRKSR